MIIHIPRKLFAEMHTGIASDVETNCVIYNIVFKELFPDFNCEIILEFSPKFQCKWFMLRGPTSEIAEIQLKYL
jgi:hypothetical protein